MTSVTSAVKFFPTAKEGFTTTTSGSVASGATTVGLNTVSGFSNGAVVVLVVDPTDTTKKQAFTGVVDVSGSQITGVVWTEGTNTAHAAGATVVDYETATHWALYSKGLLVEHNQDGTHGALTSTGAILTTPSLTTPTISATGFTNANHAHAAANSGGTLSNATLSVPYKFSVYRNAAVNSSNTATKVAFDTTLFDTGSNMTSSNKFTAPIAGFYWFAASAGNSSAIAGAMSTYLYKNGVLQQQGATLNNGASTDIFASSVTGLLQLAATDYVEVYFIGGSGSAMGVGKEYCWFQGFLISAT